MEQPVTVDAIKETDQALTIIDEVGLVEINTHGDYEAARDMMKQIKARIKEIGEVRKSQTRPLDESKKKIMDFFRGPLKKLDDAKVGLNTVMIAWVDEQERLRREEEKRLQEEARAEAEKARVEAIKEAAGDAEAVSEAIEKEPEVKPVKVASKIQQSKDSHIRVTWSAEVTMLKALVEAVAKGDVSTDALQPNMSYLNAQARQLKEDFKIPGVCAVSRKTQI